MGLQHSSQLEEPAVEVAHSIKQYTLPALARLWSREARVPAETVAGTLASGILSGELQPTYSAEEVYVFKDSNGVVRSVYLKEALRRVTIPGVQPTPFNVLDDAWIAGWMRDHLSSMAMADQTLRLIFIARDNFEAWLQNNRWPLPVFWFPENTPGKSKTGSGTQLRRKSLRATTRAICDRWHKRRDELRKDNHTRTLKNIAEEISRDKKLNPRNVSAETIRREISARRG